MSTTAPRPTAPDATGPTEDQAVSETLEDYTLRFAPRGYRRWTPMVVATTALGGIAYMADFSIGAGIGLAHGTGNALLAIAVAAVVIFVSGFPLAYYGARYNLDLDLITRGAGFGYYGSVLTSVIFASFTFIFFALEGSIMAQGLELGLGLPLWLGYLVSTLMVIPLVVHGMKALSRLQVWTTPVWLLLMVGPLVYLIAADPGTVETGSSPTPARTVTAASTPPRSCSGPACACPSSRRSASRSTTCASCRPGPRRTGAPGGSP